MGVSIDFSWPAVFQVPLFLLPQSIRLIRDSLQSKVSIALGLVWHVIAPLVVSSLTSSLDNGLCKKNCVGCLKSQAMWYGHF